MDCSLPDSSVHGILQARILEWVAIPFSRESSQPRDQTHVSCISRQILHAWTASEARLSWRQPLKQATNHKLVSVLGMKNKRNYSAKNSLAVQWLVLRTLTAESTGSIPGWGTKILQAAWYSQNKQTNKKKKRSDPCFNPQWNSRLQENKTFLPNGDFPTAWKDLVQWQRC